MPIEFISAVHTAPESSESTGGRWPAFDPDYARRYVHALDDGGFDWTLVAYGSPTTDSLQLAQYVLNHSERIRPMVAHRPGFVYPTIVAKSLATLDAIGGGRLGLHIISGGNDAEQRREGDYLDKPARYARSAEFIEILRRVWTADGPISFHGEHYRFEDCATPLRPVQETIPISVGGSSQDAYRVGGQLGDIFGLWGEPLAETAEQIATVNTYADAAGRPRPRIWNSFRPIVAPTDELAWAKAHDVLGRVQANAAAGKLRNPVISAAAPANVGSQRLLEVAARGDRHDRALWTPLVTATGGGGSTTALVGSYETVAAALVDYAEIGCDLLSIRGWEPLDDAIDYARYVLPIARQEIAHRAATGRPLLGNGDLTGDARDRVRDIEPAFEPAVA